MLARPKFDEDFMCWMFKLHVDLFAGLPGTLFLGPIGLLRVIAIVSGVMLYAPFMRKLPFGTVRHDSATRTRWLDLHNLLGSVTLAWAGVVGLTGVINALGQPLFKLWQFTEVSPMIAPCKAKPPPDRLGSLQASVSASLALEPSLTTGFVAFPGTALSSAHQCSVFMRGSTPLTARLFKPVLVDAQTAQVIDSAAPETPSVTLANGLPACDTRDWRVAPTATNLFDKTYVPICLSRGDCWWGARRNIVATVSYEF